jgi:hypothetical protein
MYLRIYPSVCLCIFMYLAIRPPVCRLPVRLSIHNCRSVFYLPVYFSVDVSVFIYGTILPPVCVSVCTLPNLICPQVSSPVPVRAKQLYL